MADSPRCPKCTKQTYKVARKQVFKCGTCGEEYHRDDFKDVDFRWKEFQGVKSGT